MSSNFTTLSICHKLAMFLVIIFLATDATAQLTTTIWSDDFESNSPSSGVRTPSNDGYLGMPSTSYFQRTNNNFIDLISGDYSGFSGTYFWAGEDHDGVSGWDALQTITFSGINISGKSNLTFKGLFAANSVNNAFENAVVGFSHTDYVLIEYQIDGGATQKLIEFRTNDPTGVDRVLYDDTNFDGIGDGEGLSMAFKEFSKMIPASGSTLTLKLSASSNAWSEEWAVDNFRVESTSYADSDGNVTASAGVTEPVHISSVFDTVGEAIDVFDFTISDGGTSDGQPMTVSQIRVNVSGTTTDTQRGQVTWRLDGPDAVNVTGTYDEFTDKITFSGLSISIPDGGNETYTINAYYNNNSNLVEDNSFILSVDGDTDFTVGAGGTQMGTTSAVTNGAGSSIDIQATRLAFTTQPAGSVSGSALTTQPVVTAQDAFGNTDVDFAETITLSESTLGALLNAQVNAISGIATFTSLYYIATADQEAVTLTANDQDGVGMDLPTVDSDEFISDVIATKLVFTTQPSPTEFINFGTPVTMTTAPVVAAVNANGVIDTGFSGSITLIEYNGAGNATLSVPSGDTDGGAASVTLNTTSGQANFTDLEIGYIPNTPGATETFNLRASASGLVAILSDQFTSTPNTAPVVERTLPNLTLNEDGVDITIPITNRPLNLGGELFSDAEEALSALTFSGSSSVADLINVSIENAPIGGGKLLKISLGEDKNGTTTVTLRATDSGGLFDEIEFDVTVNAVNDDPTFTGLPSEINLTEDTPVVFDVSAAVLADVDAGSDEVTVKFTNDIGGRFTVAASGGIPFSELSGHNSGTVTLTGTITNILTYLNIPTNIYFYPPDNLSGDAVGTITATVNDNGNTGSGGGTDIEVGTIDINITGANDAPVLTASSGTTAFVEDSGPVAIDDAIEVVDVDAGDEIVSAAVWILGNFSTGNDVLSFVNDNATIYGGISGSFNAATGVLTLTGSATPAQYQAALRSVTFNNTSDTPQTSNRTITFSVNDGEANSNGVSKTVSVTATNDPPVASNVSYTIGGDHTFAVGNALSVNYTYSDPENNNEQAYLTKWYASDDVSGTNKTVINGAESPNFFLTANQVGKYISVEVTPYDGTDYGSPVESDPDGPVFTTPTVTTSAVTSITFDSATFTGEVTSDGSNAVTERGFVYSTTENPTVSDAKFVDGDGTGDFSEIISDLDPNETYYMRSFATNTAGTVYGSQESFTTLKKALTLTGTFTAENKVYDGNAIATVSAENLILNGFAPEQSGSIQSVTYQFSQSDKGEALKVSIVELIVDGPDADNYTVSLDDAPFSTANITAKELSIAGSFTATDKTYDSYTTATVSTNSLTLDGVITGETVTLESFETNFSQIGIGENLDVTISNPILGGSDAANYTVTATGSPTTTANITAKELSITGGFTADDKTYDGNTTATLAINGLTLDGIVGSESVALASFDADFAQAHTGTGITVSISNPILGGGDAENYTITATDAPTSTANITPIELTISGTITAEDKVYDGETTATLSSNTLSLVGVLTGEAISLSSFDVNFEQANVGTGLTVSISNPTLSGRGGTENYTVTTTGSPTSTADITAKELSIAGNFTAADKTYDATSTATIATNSLTLDGVVTGENVTLASFDANFAQSNIGSGLTVTLSSPTLGGGDADNYTVTATDAPTTTANITPIELTIRGSITAENKVYDGETTATLSSKTMALVGVLTGETVELNSYDIDFSQSNIGTGLTVSLSNPTLTGADADNYTVSLVDAPSTTADITAKELSIAGSFSAADKTYDSYTIATVSTNSLTLDGVITGETVTLESFDTNFSQIGIGENLEVAISNPILGDSDAANYTVTATGAPSTTANITAKELTITGNFTAADKTYDGNTTATLAINGLTLDGIVGSESVALASFDADFAQANIGTGLTVSISNPILGGGDAENYTVTASDAPTSTANITPIELTLGGTITAENKVYDGETTATLSSNTLSLVGVLTGEDVDLDTYDVDFIQPDIGTNLTVWITNPTLTGANADNYTVTATAAPSTTADITAKELTITGSFTVEDKTYDANTTATLVNNLLALDGVVMDESVTLNTYDLNFSQSDIGTGLAVTLTNPTITGTDIENYTITATGSPTTTANITPIELTLSGTITAKNKIYDGTTTATLSSNTLALVGVLTGEDVELDSYDVDFSQSNIGTGLAVAITNPTITGSNADNYTVTATGSPSTTADITAKELSIIGSFTAKDKTYDGKSTATVATNSLTLDGVVSGETVTLNSFVLDFSQSDIGTRLKATISNPTLSGKDSDNYTVTAIDAPSTRADITAKELTIAGSFTADDKPYDGTNEATISSNALTLDGIIGNESVNLTGLLAKFSQSTIGEDLLVTLEEASISGSDSDNYTLSLENTPTTTASIEGRILTLSGNFTVVDKIYDGTSSAEITTENLNLDGVTQQGDITLNLVTASFNNASAGNEKPVQIDNFTISGAEASNYILSLDGAPNSTGSIMPKQVTLIGAVAADKVYDGTDEAELSTPALLDGVLEGEDLNLVDPTEITFDSKDAGQNKSVSARGYVLQDGTNGMASNYELTSNSIELSASINTKNLTITANSDTFVYTGTAFEGGFGATYDGFVDGEDESVLSGELQFTGSSQNAIEPGEYLIKPQGLTSNNYAITFVDGSLTILDLPRIVEVSPESGSENIAIDTQILAKVNVPVSIEDASKVYIQDADATNLQDVTVSLVDEMTIEIDHPELAYLTTYTVKIDSGAIKSSQNVLNSPFSWSFTTILERPDKVVLATPADEVKSVDVLPTLTWYQTDRAEHYTVELASDVNFAEIIEPVSATPDTTATISVELSPLSTYFWRVKATNETGDGDWSQTWKFSTEASIPTPIFPILAQTDVSTAPLMQWSVNQADVEVEFVLATDQELTQIVEESLLTATQLQITGLSSNTEYFWAVRVNDELGLSDWSDTNSFVTRPDPVETETEPVTYTFTFGSASGNPSNPDQQQEDPQTTDYRMISLPGSDNIRLDEFFPGEYFNSWRAFIETGNPIDFYEEYTPNDNRFRFTPGLGFWVLSTEIVADARMFTPVVTDENDAFGIPVHPGWNIIGNPYQSPVDWALTLAFNGINTDLWDYNESFVTTQAMDPLKAYYFYNDPSWNLTTLYLPYTGLDQRGQNAPEKLQIPDGTPVADLHIEFSDDQNTEIRWVFGKPESENAKQENSSFSVQESEHSELISFNRKHPSLDFASKGAMIIDSHSPDLGWHQLQDEYVSSGNHYELQVKASVGKSLTWHVNLDHFKDDVRLLLVNHVTKQAKLFSHDQQASIKVTEPLATYDVYIGDESYLKDIQDSMLPAEFALLQNYPNPFNPTTSIRYALPEATHVRLEVFDILGRHVNTLVNGEQQAGWHVIDWNASMAASGVYMYRIQAGSYSNVIKMTLVK